VAADRTVLWAKGRIAYAWRPRGRYARRLRLRAARLRGFLFRQRALQIQRDPPFLSCRFQYLACAEWIYIIDLASVRINCSQ